MDVAPHALGETFEEIVNELALQIADALDVQRQVDDRVRASAEIDGRSLSWFASTPFELTLTRVVLPVDRSWTKMSSR